MAICRALDHAPQYESEFFPQIWLVRYPFQHIWFDIGRQWIDLARVHVRQSSYEFSRMSVGRANRSFLSLRLVHGSVLFRLMETCLSPVSAVVLASQRFLPPSSSRPEVGPEPGRSHFVRTQVVDPVDVPQHDSHKPLRDHDLAVAVLAQAVVLVLVRNRRAPRTLQHVHVSTLQNETQDNTAAYTKR